MENVKKNNNGGITMFYQNSDFVPDDVAKGLLLFLIFETAVGLLYQIAYLIGLTSVYFSYFFNALLDAGFVLTVFIIAKSKKKKTIPQLKVNKAPNIWLVLLCIATSLICIFGFSAVTNCFLELLYSFGYSSVSGDIVIANWGTYILYTITICVLPAVCEEILFRGLIFSGLKPMGSKVAVLLSAFIFMIMHGSPDQTVHQFILGIILALAFMVTNNLWVPIIIHFFNNFIAVSLSFFAYGDTSGAEQAGEVVEIYLWQYFIYALISAAIASVLIYLVLKWMSSLCEKKQTASANSIPVTQEGTLGIEIDYKMSTAGEYSSENIVDAPPGVELNNVLRSNSKKMSNSCRFIFVLSMIWLALEWGLALVEGLFANFNLF